MATLGNPQNTIEVLQKYDFHFQKKFGQNFLIDIRNVAYCHVDLHIRMINIFF